MKTYIGKRRKIALQTHNTENSKQICPEKELRGHSPNFHIYVYMDDICTVYIQIPTIDLPILQEKCLWTDPGNI